MHRKNPSDDTADARRGTRLDKWLWAARFFKTRSVAAEEIGRGRVQVNGQPAKPSREVRPGDLLSVRQSDQPTPRVVQVRGLSEQRGPAPVAQALYEETAESVQARAAWLANRRYLTDPARAIDHGRPTKSDRRQLAEWQRWSVSLDDDPGAG
ncbi:MAG: RNA-binding S4 domain-containing protein [Burkholderiales bacterium]